MKIATFRSNVVTGVLEHSSEVQGSMKPRSRFRLPRERLVFALVTGLACTAACAPPLELREESEASVSLGGSAGLEGIVSQSGEFSHVAMGGRIVRSVVDATDHGAVQRLDLETGRADSDGWDLAFRRFVVSTNGGVNGDGGVQVARLDSRDFSELEVAPGPDANWQVDRPDGDDEGTDPDTAFNDGVGDWYEYELSDHSLTARPYVYVIRSTERRYYKLRIVDYYSEAGTSGVLTFEWAEIQAPAQEIPERDLPDDAPIVEEPGSSEPAEPGVDSFEVDASSHDDFVYLDVHDGVVDIADPHSSLSWDLALRRYIILTNGGTSGPGAGAARVDDSGRPFAEIDDTVETGLTIDEILKADGAPGSEEGTGNSVLADWYDYEGLGALSPRELTFVIRTADGQYGKFAIFEYQSGVYQVSFEPIEVLR